MTFYKGFMQCRTTEELHEEVAQVRSFVKLLGDAKGIKAIEDAMNRVMKEKGWSDSDLSPCPYCGGKAYLDFDKNDSTDSYPTETLWAVICSQCEAILYPFKTKEDAVNAWNTRHKLIKGDNR